MKLLCFGLGYSAHAAVERLRPRLERVWGTTRRAAGSGRPALSGVTMIAFDGATHSTVAAEALAKADHVLVSVPPNDNGDPVLSHFRDDLAARAPRAIVYLSTVGVYGDHGGAWVDETSECRPVSKRSLLRLAAEQSWERFSAETGVPVAIIRLAGIYGPGRGPFQKVRSGTARRIIKPGQVFNRIHVDDIAAIVDAAFDKRAGGVFNGVDDAPAPPQDVIAYAAELLGLPAPPEIAFADADLSPMARSFYGESKRVRNGKIKRVLGVTLAHPTYREGLRAALEAEAAGTDQPPP